MTATGVALPTELTDLALAVGILRAGPDGNPSSATFNNDWFLTPGEHMSKALVDEDQRAALLRLLQQLLDSSDAADGPILISSNVDGQWFPLITSDTGPTPRSGLYGVIDTLPDGRVDVSIAGLVRRAGPPDVSLAARVPLLRLSDTSDATFLAGGPDGVITIEVDIDLGATPDDSAMPLEGMAVALAIPTDGSAPSVAMRLRRPPSGETGDLVLDTNDPIDEQAVGLLAGLVTQAVDAASDDSADALGDLLALLGLTDDPQIPTLPIDRVLAEGRAVLWDWLGSLATSAGAPQAWFDRLASLLGLTTSGTGTPVDPLSLCISTGPVQTCLHVGIDQTGPAPVVVPSLSFEAPAPAGFGPGGRAEVAADLVRLTLGPSPSADLTPTVVARATLGSPGGGAPLVNDTLPGVGVMRVQAARVGVAAGPDPGVRLVVEALGVQLGTTSFASLDLTDTDALIDAAGTTLNGILSSLLAALGDTPAARAVLVLAGVRRPDGTDAATWPHQVTPADLFSDPVGAVQAYHLEVLAAGRWTTLVADMARLLQADAALPVATTGTGVAGDPWRVALFQDAGARVDLTAWATDDAADGTRVHMGISAVPPSLPLGGTGGPALSMALDGELLSLRLATSDGSGIDPDPLPLGRLGLVLRIGDDLRLETGPVRFTARSIRAGLAWSRDLGLAPDLNVEQPRAQVGDQMHDIDLPRYDPTQGRFVWDGDIPWALLEQLLISAAEALRSATARRATRLAGWRPGEPAHLPAVPPPPGSPALDGSTLSLEDLVRDPLRVLESWAVRVLLGPDGQQWAREILGWVTEAAGSAALSGTGADTSPWAAPLLSGDTVALTSSLGAIGGRLGRSLPAIPVQIRDFADEGLGPAPTVDDLVAVLERAAPLLPPLDTLLDRAGTARTALDGLRTRLAGTDGVASRVSQHAITGATAVEISGVGQLSAAGAFDAARHLSGGPPPAGRIFVRTDVADAADWPDADPSRVVDLTTAGVGAAGFDLSGISGDGPWFVLLPSRGGTGITDAAAAHAELVARLRRVVDTVRTSRASSAPLAVIAHGTAGHAARALAADAAAGLTHLTTLASPHGGGDADWAADPVAGEAVRIVQSLRDLVDLTPGELPDADVLLDVLDGLTDGPRPDPSGSLDRAAFPGEDVGPPAGIPAVAAGVSVTTVASVLDESLVDRGLSALVTAVVDGLAAGATTAATDAVRDALAWGLRFRPITPTPDATGVQIALDVRVDLAEMREPDDDAVAIASTPRLHVHARIDRAGGWLLGGPGSGAPRGSPRCRSVDIDVDVGINDGLNAEPDGGGASGSARLHLEDAAVFGVRRPTWTVALGDGTGDLPANLTPEVRVLLGQVAASFGVVPASGSVRALTDLLEALGLARIGIDGRLALEVDPLEQALVDPVSAVSGLGDTARDQIASALSALAGTTPSPGGPVRFSLGSGVELELGLGSTEGSTESPARLAVSTSGDGVPLAAGLSLSGGATVDVTGHITGTLRLGLAGSAGPAGRPVLVVTADTSADPAVSASVEMLDAGDSVRRSLALLPTPDTSALGDVVASAAPAELARLALSLARDRLPAVGALLEAAGLGAPADPLRLPAALLRDPGGWLLDGAALGAGDGRPDPAAVSALFDAASSLLPGTSSPGTVDLPWGLVLRSQSVPGGGMTLSLAWPSPVEAAGISLGGSAALVLTSAGELDSALTVDVSLPDPADPSAVVGGLSVDIGGVSVGGTVAVTARVGATDLPLLPSTAGLGALAGAAAERALPLALDALATADVAGIDIGAALRSLGDALALRFPTGTAGRFSASELQVLAADPAGQLTSRISANVPAALAALRELVAPVVPGTVSVTGSVLTLEPSPHVRIRLDLDGVPAATPKICVEVIDTVPVEGLSVSGELCISDRVDLFSLGSAVTDRDLLLGLLPAIDFAVGPDAAATSGRLDLSLWFDPPGTPGREAVAVVIDLTGGVSVVCRGEGRPDAADLTACTLGLLTRVLLPRAGDLVLAVDEIVTLLDEDLSPGVTLGDVLVNVDVLERPAPGAYRLDDDLFDFTQLPRRVLAGTVESARLLVGDLTIPGLEPLTFSIASDTADGLDVFGLGISIPAGEQLTIVDTDEVRLGLEVDARWVERAEGSAPTNTTGGARLLLLGMPTGGGDPALVPWFQIRGLGLRVDKSDDTKLLDLGVSIRSIALHGWYERADGVIAPELGGGHLELDRLAVPLGDASGNPVASSFLSGDDSGDTEDLAPGFSPAIAVYSTGSGVEIDLRAGEGEGPWWLPIQRAFGPLYVDQVGLGVDREDGDIEAVSFLVDGGAALAGLTVQVDDLEVIIPWASPLDPGTWRLDLAGLAVGFDSSGVTVSGGLRKFVRNGEPDYVGVLRVTFSVYGATAVGGYGVFDDGAGSTYTSFFLFAAVNAPIGGPPAFFVTGLGGGMGLNRRLIAPDDITDVPDFPLVAALDPDSVIATDPMGALDTLGATFPPERGAIWFAAGLNFTSFALVETTAVLTVEIDDGLEINLFGLSRMTLPPAPAPPMAQVELALHARFSSSEAILSVVAQLTDNSWIVNESVRLTGGFAFAIWFNDGQFVLTLGGYGPAFDKPDRFPDVPRLGFAWEPGGGVVVKGGGYFALTSSCVMAGGGLEIAYNSGSVWARLEAGIHVLVSWDPFFYDFRFHVEVSAGVRWKTFLGTIRLSFSFGVRVHIIGPKLRGSATLDLDVVSITVRFGPSSSPNSATPISWSKFLDTYLLDPPDEGAASGDRHVLAATVGHGADPAGVKEDTQGGADPDAAPDGSFARPYKVIPEFSLTVTTRSATQTVRSVFDLPASITARQLDLGPMYAANVRSELSARFRKLVGEDVTGRFDLIPITGNVPEAVWKVIPLEADAEANTIPTVTGVTLVAKVDIEGPAIRVEVNRVRVSDNVHPLPFGAERRASGRAAFTRARTLSQTFTRLVLDRAETDDVFDAVVALVTLGVRAPDERLGASDVRQDRHAPPRLVSLTAGIGDRSRGAVGTSARPPVDVVDVLDTSLPPPRLEGIVEIGGAGPPKTDPPFATTVRRSRSPRRPAPVLSDVIEERGGRSGAELHLAGADVQAKQRTVLPLGAPPASRMPGGVPERQRRLGVDQAFRDATAKKERALTGAGSPLRAGEAQVWRLSGTDFDASAERPHLVLEGSSPSRVVILDRGQSILVDTSVTSGTVEIPRGSDRIALFGAAEPAGVGTVGWTDAAQLVQIAADTYAGHASVLRAHSVATRRRAGSVTVSARRGDAAVERADVTETTLNAQVATIVIVLDGQAEGEDAATHIGLVIGGTTRNESVPDRILTVGDRTLIVVAVTPKRRGTVSAVVTPAPGQRLVGVLGSGEAADSLARRLEDEGLQALAPPELGRPGIDVSTVVWKGTP